MKGKMRRGDNIDGAKLLSDGVSEQGVLTQQQQMAWIAYALHGL